jgi:hypothetical protein
MLSGSLTIPGSVTNIGQSAFSHCSGLQSVTIQDGVKQIGRCAFYGCTHLNKIYIPASVTSLESHAISKSGEITQLTIFYKGTEEQWNTLTEGLNITYDQIEFN